MIGRFRNKGVERFFASGDTSGINAQHTARLRRLLTKLKGKRAGQWAVSVSGNWRLVFEFEGDDATNVDLVDYH
jgi:proteic killer suppression protein